jgi:hypothetical protein
MNDELRDEYQFDYKQAKPNRFAAKLQKGGDSSSSTRKLRPRSKGRRP